MLNVAALLIYIFATNRQKLCILDTRYRVVLSLIDQTCFATYKTIRYYKCALHNKLGVNLQTNTEKTNCSGPLQKLVLTVNLSYAEYA